MAKALQSFETCQSVTSNLFGKLVSLFVLPIIVDDSFKVITPVPFFVAAINSLSCVLILIDFIKKVILCQGKINYETQSN